MRHMQLSEMLTMLRYETGISANVAHGVTQDVVHTSLLQRIQEELYLAWDWPHLRTSQTKAVEADTRYLAYPDKFSFVGVEQVEAKFGADTKWTTCGYGIGPEHLNVKDSDADTPETDTRVRRWQNYLSPDAETISVNMFEVWPIPSVAGTLRFYGRQVLFALAEEEDVSTIDGPLVILHAAAEILAKQKSEDAALKLQKAIERQRLLKLRQAGGDHRTVNRAGPAGRPALRRGIDYMPEA